MNFKEETIDSKLIFNGKIIKVYLDHVKTPYGNLAEREHIKHNGGVAILAIVDNKIIMEKQFRYPYKEVIYELPAGKLEPSEDSYSAGLRELEEETGYKAQKLISYGCIYPTVGYSNEIIYLYKAEGLSKSEQHLDKDEYVELLYLDEQEIKQLLKDNKIKDSKTICLLSKYFLGL